MLQMTDPTQQTPETVTKAIKAAIEAVTKGTDTAAASQAQASPGAAFAAAARALRANAALRAPKSLTQPVPQPAAAAIADLSAARAPEALTPTKRDQVTKTRAEASTPQAPETAADKFSTEAFDDRPVMWHAGGPAHDPLLKTGRMPTTPEAASTPAPMDPETTAAPQPQAPRPSDPVLKNPPSAGTPPAPNPRIQEQVAPDEITEDATAPLAEETGTPLFEEWESPEPQTVPDQLSNDTGEPMMDVVSQRQSKRRRSAHLSRLRRLDDYRQQSLRDPDPFLAMLGGLNCDLAEMAYRVNRAALVMLHGSPVNVVQQAAVWNPILEAGLKVMRQADRLAHLTVSMRSKTHRPRGTKPAAGEDSSF
jgi:hypothetical protein